MNTKQEIESLTLAICERLGLTLLEVMDVQVDLAKDYLGALIERGHLQGPDDAELLSTVPEFWAWWRQRWANLDRGLLAGVSRLDLVEWQARGVDTQEVYRDYCRHLAAPDRYPNDVLMAAFAVAKRQQDDAFTALKNLFQPS